MANIMVNDVCNLKCPYCFANEYVNGDTSTDITYANFKKAVDWINKSSDIDKTAHRVALIGGEPLLHHQFEDLIEYASRERRPGQELLVFTNGIYADKYVDLFSRHRVSLLLNINSYEDIGQKAYDRLVNNIRLLRLKGVHASIGINFYKADQDMSFILNIIKEFGFLSLRIGIVSPNTEEKRSMGSFFYYNEIKDSLMNFIEECAKLGCAAHFDCQKIPFCIMRHLTDRVRKIEEENHVSLDLFDCRGCHPVLDITTDLKVARCFGVSKREDTYPMDLFETEHHAEDFFRTNYDNPGLLIPGNPECVTCKERVFGYCQGGCLSYKLDKINQILRRPQVSEIQQI